jgi:hypothetical protein
LFCCFGSSCRRRQAASTRSGLWSARLRDAGRRLDVVTNQSGIGLGMIMPGELNEVNRRIEELLGALRHLGGLPARGSRSVRLP